MRIYKSGPPKPQHDLTGKTFGRLTVLRFVGRGERYSARYEVKCTCGTVKVVVGSSLTQGLTTSCGCFHREQVGNINRSHSRSATREYFAWQGMRGRCTANSGIDYERYASRGISVCPRWESFENFFADMGPCPKGYTLERKDNDGNYDPSNCVWAPWKVQQRNKSTTRWITFRGVTKPLINWAEETGIAREAIAYRLDQGWSVERALTTEGGLAKGGKVSTAKVTEDIVREIRKRYKDGRGKGRSGPNSAASMAKEFGISNACVMNIVKRKTWKHVN